MKRMMLIVLALLMCLPLSAYASSVGVSASMQGGKLNVSWQNCGSNATLTVYRDGWPVLVECVSGSNYQAPAWATQTAGRYSVKVATAQGCEKVDVGSSVPTAVPTAEPTAVPTAEPTAVPTAEPTAVPTAEPTAEPTAVPTAEPTAVPTAKPTAVPTAKPTAVPTAKPTAVPTAKPTAVPTAKPTETPSGSTLDQMAAEVVRQVNEERAKAGLSALTVDSELTRAACVRAQEIVQVFSHTRPDGSSWSSVSSKANGENIAMGQQTADKVMAAWMSSQGHRENILRSSFGSIGVCAYKVGNVIYWAQLFGR